MTLRYLRGEAIVEPLIESWYAWSYLIFPATAALYFKNSHVPLMESFVQTPKLHVQALQNPALRGGPYVDCATERADDVRALLDRTRRTCAEWLTLAAQIEQLDNAVATAKGSSLEPLYAEVPSLLRGLVELNYDGRNRAGVRFLESLIYRTPLYAQQKQALSLSLGVRRAFQFSTPRLESDAELHLPLPFVDDGLDYLYELRRKPAQLSDICERLRVPTERQLSLETFLTTEIPARRPHRPPDEFRVRYFGHACVLFETPSTSVLFDPVVRHAGGAGPEPRLTLPERIDYVVITHAHQDHCALETLLELRARIETVVVPRSGGAILADISLKHLLLALGFKRVIELDELETLGLPDGELTALPFLGEHGDLAVRTKAGFLLRLGKQRSLLLADSNNLQFEMYERLFQLLGPVDRLFIGMECEGGPLSWLYGPLIMSPLTRAMDQSRRFTGSNCAKAEHVVRCFRPGEVYVYAMGMEPWMATFMVMNYTAASKPIVESDAFLAFCQGLGIRAARPLGETDLVGSQNGI